jgi:hypothetical protein
LAEASEEWTREFLEDATWNVLEKRRLFDMAILALALGWQIGVGGHTQIIFYSFVLMGFLYVVWLF